MELYESTSYLQGQLYGPAELVYVEKSEKDLLLTLRQKNGRLMEAQYETCKYAQLSAEAEGIRIIQAQEATLEALRGSPALAQLRYDLTLANPERCIAEWVAQGFKLYIHYGEAKTEEYLIVAKNMQYRI